MLTNFQTVFKRLQRLKELESIEQTGGQTVLSKKEALMLKREQIKLARTLGGIREMTKIPSAVWIIDTNKEHIAVDEARKLGIPVIAILDSNCDPDMVNFPIPGNDDAIRAVSLYCDLVAGAVLDGIRAEIAASGGDVGALDEPPVEEVPAAEPAAGAEASPAE